MLIIGKEQKKQAEHICKNANCGGYSLFQKNPFRRKVTLSATLGLQYADSCLIDKKIESIKSTEQNSNL